jgi:hypothetical protein
MSPEDQRPRDPSSADEPPVLEYAGPRTGRDGPKGLPPGAASVILGAEVALGSIAVAERNAVVALPLGLLVASAIYFILTVVRKRPQSALVVGQLVLALTVTIVVVFITLVRGAAATEGAGGFQYWLTYNPGYWANSRWAMQYLWLAGVSAAWFIAVATYIRWKAGTNSPGPASSRAH